MQQLISWSKNLAVLHFKQILLKLLGESGFPPYKMVTPKTFLKNLFEMLINLTSPKWLAQRCM